MLNADKRFNRGTRLLFLFLPADYLANNSSAPLNRAIANICPGWIRLFERAAARFVAGAFLRRATVSYPPTTATAIKHVIIRRIEEHCKRGAYSFCDWGLRGWNRTTVSLVREFYVEKNLGEIGSFVA